MSLTLTYFDFDGSRGLEARLALSVAGVDFTDDRIKREQWPGLKPQVPFGALPVLTVGDRRLAQSTAILFWVGRTHGLLPEDPWTAAEHAALMQSVEDLRHKVPGSRGKDPDTLRAERQDFASGWLRQWGETIAARIQGPYLEGDALHVADIKLYVILRSVLGGVYDHVPGSIFDDLPKIKGLYDAVDAHPAVRAWLDR